MRDNIYMRGMVWVRGNCVREKERERGERERERAGEREIERCRERERERERERKRGRERERGTDIARGRKRKRVSRAPPNLMTTIPKLTCWDYSTHPATFQRELSKGIVPNNLRILKYAG
jgi:hypothetical protein